MAQTHDFEPIAYNASQFHYQADTKKLVAEASDFGPGGFRLWQIYPDACDEGIAVRGKSGAIVIYALSHVDQKDGDLRAWEFEPISESLRAVPSAKGTSVVIFND